MRARWRRPAPDGRPLTLSYDSLVVAAGVGQSYFGHDEFAQWAPGMKTLDDALAQHARIFGAFEMAELEEDPEHAEGVADVRGRREAGRPASRSRGRSRSCPAGRSSRTSLASTPPRRGSSCSTAGKEILASFGDRLSGKATRELERTGVEIHCDSIVTDVDADGVVVKGADGAEQRIAAKTVIWAAGVSASPLAGMLADACGAECDRAGRIKVLPDCSTRRPSGGVRRRRHDGATTISPASPRSRCSRASTPRGRSRNGWKATNRQPFKYRDLGSMAAVSRRRAIVSFHGIRVSGFLGWLMWLVVHITFMTGFKNRFKTLTGWLFSFLGSGRTERALRVERIDR